MIKIIIEKIEEVLNNYIDASNEPFRGHHIAKLIRKGLPEYFRDFIDDPKKYKIMGFPGKGGWAFVPWISFTNADTSSSPQKNYSVVYFFKEDMSGFYLSLNLGINEFNKKLGKSNLAIIAENFRDTLQSNFYQTFDYKPMDLGCRTGYLKRDSTIVYENADIFNIEYTLEDLPSEAKLRKDLYFFFELYDYLFEERDEKLISDSELERVLNSSNDDDLPLLFKPTKQKTELLEDCVNLSIQNFGAISESNINISKINVIGGQNATGKSTSSKLLYCFLKYNSANLKEYA